MLYGGLISLLPPKKATRIAAGPCLGPIAELAPDLCKGLVGQRLRCVDRDDPGPDRNEMRQCSAPSGAFLNEATRFTLIVAQHQPGQSVFAVGSVPALGTWDPAKAIKLQPNVYYQYVVTDAPERRSGRRSSRFPPTRRSNGSAFGSG